MVENILIERIQSTDAPHTSINPRRSQKVTIRYSNISGARGSHGIGVKDCWLLIDMDSIGYGIGNEDGYVSRAECAQGDDKFWSENLAFYSNVITNNYKVGIDSHADNVEIAGNIISENSQQGSKLPEPATGVWFHDNLIEKNALAGFDSKTQYGIEDADMFVTNHVYYRNHINNNGGALYGGRTSRAVNMLFLDNEYINNGNQNKPNIGNSCNGSSCNPTPQPVIMTYLCPNSSTEVGKSGIDGGAWFSWLDIEHDACDINNVADPFVFLPQQFIKVWCFKRSVLHEVCNSINM